MTRTARLVVAVLLACVAFGVAAARSTADTPGQVLFDSINTPGATVVSEEHQYWSAVHSGQPAPLPGWVSGFYAARDSTITGITVMASSSCTASCADIQFYFVEENATGDGVSTPVLDPSTPGYARIPDDAIPRSPVPDEDGAYLAPLTIMFPTPLPVQSGHGYFLIAQDADVSYSGTHVSLGRVAGAAPAGEFVTHRPFAPPPSRWFFSPCSDGLCVALQAFDGTAPLLPQPIAAAVNGAQRYGSSAPIWSASAAMPGGVTMGGAATCGRGAALTVGGRIAPIGPQLPTGNYQIDSASCDGLTLAGSAASNYRIEYIGETFTVSPAVLTVRADNVTRPYGLPNPGLTYSYSGFVNGESPSLVQGGPPTLSTVASTTSTPGFYPINVDGHMLSAANYTIDAATGTLTIVRATPVISAPTMHVSTALSNGRVQFTATLHNTTPTGPAVVGVPVTFSARSSLGIVVKCTGVTNASGVATCVSHDVLDFALARPRLYTITVPANLHDYTAARTVAVIAN